MLVNAVDIAISGDKTGSLDSMNITEIATIINMTSNDLGP